MLPLSLPSVDTAEIARIREAFAGRLAGDGPIGQRVERRLAALLGAPRVLLTPSCTAAMELALMTLGIEGGEVLCPSFTFSSTANAILRAGGKPVFVDIEPETLAIDPNEVERHCGPRTVGMMVVHYAGIAAQMDKLEAFAKDRGIVLVEDAAQGFMASFRGKMLGTFGQAGAFSFHETKNITCGEGGALVLHGEDEILRAEAIREKGTNRRAFLRGTVDKYTWVSDGTSHLLPEILAAVLDVQLDKLSEIQGRREAVVRRYRAGLTDWANRRGVILPPELPDRISNAHIFYLLFPDQKERDAAITYLRERDIQAAFHYVPLHSSPKGSLYPQGAMKVTDQVAAGLLRLPLHAQLYPEDADYIIDRVNEL